MRTQRVNVMAGSVQKLLRRNAYGHVKNLLAKLRAADISSIMLEMNDREQRSVFSILMERDRQLAAETLKVLGLEWGLDLLLQRPSEEIGEVIQEMESDVAAAFISALPEEVAQEVLGRMDNQESSEVQELLGYQEETAGRIMTPNMFSLHEELTVGEAIRTIQTAQDL